jgi:hypothetical protein
MVLVSCKLDVCSCFQEYINTANCKIFVQILCHYLVGISDCIEI